MRTKKLLIIDTYKEAWHEIESHFEAYVWVLLAGIILSMAAFSIVAGSYLAMNLIAPSWASGLVAAVVGFFVSTFVTMGFTNVFLQASKSKAPEVNNFFNCTDKYLRYCTAAFIYCLIVGLGFMLFIIPGIILLLKYFYSTILILDKNTSVSDAFNKSDALTMHQKWHLLLFFITLAGINALAAKTVILAIAFFPITSLAIMISYRKLS